MIWLFLAFMSLILWIVLTNGPWKPRRFKAVCPPAHGNYNLDDITRALHQCHKNGVGVVINKQGDVVGTVSTNQSLRPNTRDFDEALDKSLQELGYDTSNPF